MIYYIPLPSGILGLTFLLLATGSSLQETLTPLPVEAEQLTCTVSGEVELTLARSSPCWRKDIKVGWHNSSASGGTLLSHVFVWVQSLIQCALQQEAGSQWSYPVKPAGLINIEAMSASLGITSAYRVL